MTGMIELMPGTIEGCGCEEGWAFAEKRDDLEEVRLFVKLPRWFTVETPVGSYNPDWAIVKVDDPKVYPVRETKGNTDLLKLRTVEADKIRCGREHFKELGVDFNVVASVTDL